MQDNKTFILPVTAVASKVGINDSNIWEASNFDACLQKSWQE